MNHCRFLGFVSMLAMLCPTCASAGQKRAPHARWVGKDYIFVSYADKGYYDGFHVVGASVAQKKKLESGNGINGAAFFRKIIKCVAARPTSVTFYSRDYNVKIVHSASFHWNPDGYGFARHIEGLAAADEIDIVRDAFLGKTVWALRVSYCGPYHTYAFDLVKNQSTNEEIEVPDGTKMVITKVMWSGRQDLPVVLVARTDDSKYIGFYVEADSDNKDDYDGHYWTYMLLSNNPPDQSDTASSGNDSTATDSDSPIAQFSGTTTQDTATFTIPQGHKGYIVWTAKPKSMNGYSFPGAFIADVQDPANNSTVSGIASVFGADSGSTYCYHTGTFYIHVTAGENWSIDVYVR